MHRMRRGLALGAVIAVIGCGAFGSDDGTAVTPSVDGGGGPDGGASPDSGGAASWCATQHPNAIFCDDFETDWATNGMGWDARGPVERTARDTGGMVLRAHAALVNHLPAQVALYKTFAKKKSHVAYSFDFRAVKLTPVNVNDYFNIPVTMVLTGAPRSSVDLEHHIPDGDTWLLRATGYNTGSPQNVDNPAGFPPGGWTRVSVEVTAVDGGNDSLSVRFGNMVTPTTTKTTFSVNDDVVLGLGSDGPEATDGDGEFDFEFDNFLVEALD